MGTALADDQAFNDRMTPGTGKSDTLKNVELFPVVPGAFSDRIKVGLAVS